MSVAEMIVAEGDIALRGKVGEEAVIPSDMLRHAVDHLKIPDHSRLRCGQAAPRGDLVHAVRGGDG